MFTVKDLLFGSEEELAADNESLVAIDEVGLGIILLDGVLGQDGQREQIVEFGLVLEGQDGGIINLVLLGSTGSGEKHRSGQEQEAKGEDEWVLNGFHKLSRD